MSRRLTRATVAAALLVSLFTLAYAEDVEKKFRISLAIGGHNARDEVASDSANNFALLDEDGTVEQFFADPRNDSAAFNDLKIEPAPRVTLAAQYAVNKVFMVEASVGYQEGDVGDIEMQFESPFVFTPPEKDFSFSFFQIPAGEMTQVPIQLSGMARFRPRANFNPYLGAGVGYVVIGFDPSPELNELSLLMDNSVGGQSVLRPGPGGLVPLPVTEITDLTGATVDARDTFEWHLLGGAELTLKKKWALFLDFRYMFASRTMSIGFNGADSLGVSVPQLVADLDEAGEFLFTGSFGPYSLASGGLVDAGSLVPSAIAPPGTDCEVTPSQCEFVFEPDGELDLGLYYVQGGSFRYDGVSLQFGVRYTF